LPIASIIFLFSTLLFTSLASKPDSFWCLLPLIIAVVLFKKAFFVPQRIPIARLIFFTAVALFWNLIYIDYLHNPSLDPRFENKEIAVSGYINSIPVKRPFGWRISLKLITPFPGTIRLNWYSPKKVLLPGQVWRLKVKLKQRSGFQNPGGFNYETWLFSRGYSATGYVRKSTDNKLLSQANMGINYWRYQFYQKLQQLMSNTHQSPVAKGLLIALAIGERQHIGRDQWRVLANTGTSHLLAISGLHIGIAAGSCFFLVSFIWSRFYKLTLLFPARKIAALFAVVAAGAYTLLAGFTIPTQRALIMTSVLMAALFFGVKVRSSDLLCVALLFVLLLNPLSVLMPGFWLSFLAVAIILFVSCHRIYIPRFWRWQRVQWAITLALIPLTIFFMQNISIISPIANMIAIPLVSIAIVPILLVTLLLIDLLPNLAEVLLMINGFLLECLWSLLQVFSSYQWSHLQWANSSVSAVVMAMLGLLILLMPAGYPGKLTGLILCLPLFCRPAGKLPINEVLITILDVGQGSSLLVQTRNHALVYDTGPKFRSGFNTGEAVVVPFLRHSGISKLDKIIVSHQDNDHSGGLKAILKSYQPKQILLGQPLNIRSSNVSACKAGQTWTWDGIKFAIIHPQAGQSYKNNNNHSCVLRVSVGPYHTLMTGDISSNIEKRLISSHPQQLRANILIAPHHGSKSSSSSLFIQRVAAEYVVFTVGYLNRYRFPNKKVVSRYKKSDAVLLSTDKTGAIQFRINAKTGIRYEYSYRIDNQRFWYRRTSENCR